MPNPPVTWDVNDVTLFTDGDTFWGQASRSFMVDHLLRATLNTESKNGVKFRLVIVQAADKKTDELGYYRDKGILTGWLMEHEHELCAEVYEVDNWGRWLADVYVRGDRNNTASKFMLLSGVPPYQGTR